MLQAARAVALATLALFPLLVWPGARQPFVTPRLLLLAASNAVLAVLLLLGRIERPRWPTPLAWSTAALVAAFAASSALAPHVSLQAMATALLPLAWAWLLTWTGLEIRRISNTLIVVGMLLSAWTLAQFAGLDPLRAIGWQPAIDYGPRMRMYASIGNPNFVGAVLAALLPLAVAIASRGPRSLGIAIVVAFAAALAATGSRGAWLGSAAGVAALALARRPFPRRVLVPAALLLAAVGLALALRPTRPLGETLRGRLYIWSVAAPHAADHPLVGFGPGSVAVRYPRWQADHLRQGLNDDVRRYAAAQRHLHNDYLEALIDLGIPGAAAWLSVIVTAAVAGLRAQGNSVQDIGGAGAGIVALAAVALVDFPFARPVELFVFWTLAVCTTTNRSLDPSTNPASHSLDSLEDS
jgi:O-antigen ligase